MTVPIFSRIDLYTIGALLKSLFVIWRTTLQRQCLRQDQPTFRGASVKPRYPKELMCQCASAVRYASSYNLRF